MRLSRTNCLIVPSTIVASICLVGVAFAYPGGSILLQPVLPKTVPPSDYPQGTTIIGQEIILGAVPARVWLDVHVTNWAPDNIKTAYVTISATDPEMDGGGFSGSNAECSGSPANGAASLYYALQSCNTNADCRSQVVGQSALCGLGEPSHCTTYPIDDGNYLPGKYCEPFFQDRCASNWIGRGLSYTSAIDPHVNVRMGINFNPFEAGNFPTDFHPSYLGTIVIDVPANAKGTYTLDFPESWLDNGDPPGSNDIPVPIPYPAKITVPCGRCCYELSSANPQCVDHVSANECAGYGVGAVFAANEVCPQGGGAACPACGLDEHCDDGVFCNGVEVCQASGECGPGQPPCLPWEECGEGTDSCAPRIPAVSHWGLVVLVLTFLIAAKVRRQVV